MKYHVITPERSYYGLDSYVELECLFKAKRKKTDEDTLLEIYFDTIKCIDLEEQNKTGFLKAVQICYRLKEYDIPSEVLVYDDISIQDAYGYKIEWLGFDVSYDLCESLIEYASETKAAEFLNEYGLCKTVEDVEAVIPLLENAGLEWKPCYVYRVLLGEDKMREVFIKNASSQNVKVLLNGQMAGIVEAGQRKGLSYMPEIGNEISLCQPKDSYGKMGRAHMNIMTTYDLLEMENKMEFVVTREKMRFASEGYYDIFWMDEEDVKPVKYEVVGVEQLRSQLVHEGILWKFLEPLEDMIIDMVFAPIRSILIAGLILVFLGWKWLLGFFGVLYVIYFIGNCVGKGVAEKILSLFGDRFKTESMEEQLKRWTNPDFMTAFYANPNRKPYLGKIER